MQPLKESPHDSERADRSFDHIPAHLQPTAYSDTHPQLATLVTTLLHTLHTTAPTTPAHAHTHTTRHLYTATHTHHTLSLLHHHAQQALAAHPHRFPALVDALQRADLAYCIQSQGVVGGVGGVAVEDVWEEEDEVIGLDDFEVREERRRLVAMVEQRLAAHLEAMRVAYEDDASETGDSNETQLGDDGDKENSQHGNNTAVRTSNFSDGKLLAELSCTSSPTSRPLSAAFVALTSPPSHSLPPAASVLAIASPPPSLDPVTCQLQHRLHQLQRQHVALQLHLLSLQARLLSDHRLTTVAQHDATHLATLDAKAHCLSLKLQLMTAHADLLDPPPASAGQTRGEVDGAGVWDEVLGRLRVRQTELESEVGRVDGVRAGYTAVCAGVCGAEWRETSVRWRDVLRRAKEKQWALAQLSS